MFVDGTNSEATLVIRKLASARVYLPYSIRVRVWKLAWLSHEICPDIIRPISSDTPHASERKFQTSMVSLYPFPLSLHPPLSLRLSLFALHISLLVFFCLCLDLQWRAMALKITRQDLMTMLRYYLGWRTLNKCKCNLLAPLHSHMLVLMSMSSLNFR
jgi:hypothetical protein